MLFYCKICFVTIYVLYNLFSIPVKGFHFSHCQLEVINGNQRFGEITFKKKKPSADIFEKVGA